MAAHKCMSTAKIFSHLLNKARPILGADQAGPVRGRGAAAAGFAADDDDAQPPRLPRKSKAAAPRNKALARAINKKSRNKHRGAP